MPADEFDIIRRLFAPLARHRFARGLRDDVAVIEPERELIVTADAIVEGVHFLPDDPLESVAKKALRVNVSDLAAKGALPVGFLLTLMWPKHRDALELESFARGLGEDLALFEAALLGGDTTGTAGPLAISVTAFGVPHGKRTPARADAQPGDQLWVTGVIGDAWLGFRSLTRAPDVAGASAAEQLDAHAASVRAAYRTPSPPLAFAPHIAALAHASMDVSDGLIGDAAKLAEASGVGIRIDAEAIPLSAAGHAHCAGGDAALIELITGGDDYQALFTAAPGARAAVISAARESETNVALIGDVTEGAGVRVVKGSRELTIATAGHRHNLGR